MEIAELKKLTGLKTDKEIVDYALVLLATVVLARENGGTIFITGYDDDEGR